MKYHQKRANYKTPPNHNCSTHIKGKTQQGFTVIEAIIVLVIAAIIMLIVFLVVPQLQRNARNGKAQAAARQISAAAITYRTQQGTYPTCAAGSTACAPITDITGPLKSPAGTAYNYVIDYTLLTNNKVIMIINNSACGASRSSAPVSSTGKFIVVIFQETSGSGSTLCYETP